MTRKATRREFCQRVAGGTAWAVGGASGIPWASSNCSNESAGNSTDLDQTQAPDGDLLTNPRYAVGAKFRLAQFIQSAPTLAVNGAKDPWITIQDLYLLLESGEPKSARVYPESGHMGAGAETEKLVMSWLKSQLT